MIDLQGLKLLDQEDQHEQQQAQGHQADPIADDLGGQRCQCEADGRSKEQQEIDHIHAAEPSRADRPAGLRRTQIRNPCGVAHVRVIAQLHRG